ncbi:hypothetical protein Btru_023014 [Bulinus truncatus]|nr:hypothetical protein Btru_023014 [Bulinus truncatus]
MACVDATLAGNPWQQNGCKSLANIQCADARLPGTAVGPGVMAINIAVQHTSSTYQFVIAVQHTSSTYQFNIAVQHTSSTYQFIIAVQHTSSTYQFNIAVQHTSSTYQFNKPAGGRQSMDKRVFSNGCFAQFNDSLLHLAEHSRSTKSCQSGYVHGVDRFIYSGYVNTTDVNITSGQTLNFEIQHPGSAYSELICLIHLGNVTCDNRPVYSECYCRSNISSILEIIFNITADIMFSQKILNFSWAVDSLGQKNMYIHTSLPAVYNNTNITLIANGQNLQLDSCNVTVLTDLQITWCVENLANHTLMIATPNLNNLSQNDCVTYVITSCVIHTNFIVSYEETQGCHRKESFTCTIYVQEKSQKSCEDECQDVVLTHAILTAVVIVVSTISIVSIITDRESPLNILLVLLSLVVIAQTILVVIAGTAVEYNGTTTLHIWKILIIYQCAIYILFISVQFIILNIRTKLDSSCLGKPWIFLLAMICIHSVFGMVFLPVLIKNILKDKQDKDIQLQYVSRIQ